MLFDGLRKNELPHGVKHFVLCFTQTGKSNDEDILACRESVLTKNVY